MSLYLLPRDLGAPLHVALVRNRVRALSYLLQQLSGRTENLPQAKMGFVEKQWVRGVNVSPEVAAITVPMAAEKSRPLRVFSSVILGLIPLPTAAIALALHHPDVAAVSFAAGSAGAWGVLVDLPRRAFRRLHEKPIQPQEIEALLSTNLPGFVPLFGRVASRVLRQLTDHLGHGAPDELRERYLKMVLAALQQRGLTQEKANELRSAIHSLGEAISSLPPVNKYASQTQIADIAADAEMLSARAARETDPVVAASLMRQAEALVGQARASQNTIVLERRTRTLRQELLTQIDALQVSLPSLANSTPNRANDHRFTQVADAVQNIVREAVAVSEAREELEISLRPAHSYLTDTQEPEQVIRRR